MTKKSRGERRSAAKRVEREERGQVFRELRAGEKKFDQLSTDQKLTVSRKIQADIDKSPEKTTKCEQDVTPDRRERIWSAAAPASTGSVFECKPSGASDFCDDRTNNSITESGRKKDGPGRKAHGHKRRDEDGDVSRRERKIQRLQVEFLPAVQVNRPRLSGLLEAHRAQFAEGLQPEISLRPREGSRRDGIHDFRHELQGRCERVRRDS